MRHDVSVGEAHAMLEQDAVLLDVRELDEWQEGHAPQAVHIPMSQLSGRVEELPRDRTIVCVCHVGGRSAVVSEALNRAGWQAVNLAGGMQAWEYAGSPIVVDDPA